MANQWFRMYGEFINDPKVQMLSEIEQRRYIMLLCIKCNGTETLHDEQVAFQLRISNEEWLSTKAILISKNLIDSSNNPIAWDKRQYISDCSTERVKRYREKMKQQCNVSETPPDTESETDTEVKEKKINKKRTVTSDEMISDVKGLSIDIANDYLDHRKSKKASLTTRAWSGIAKTLNEFIKLGGNPDNALAKAIERNWTGLEIDWLTKIFMPNVHQFPDKKPSMQANTGNINYREGLRIGSDGEYIF